MSSDIEFLSSVNSPYTDNARIRNIIPRRIIEKRRLYNALKLPQMKTHVPDRYNNYELIHFHETKTMYLCRDFLEQYDGKVILTSHSPCAYHKELLERLNSRDRINHSKELAELEILDEYSFNRADVIVFPCKEAEEPYFHSWEKYEKNRDAEKIRYLPTGIIPCEAQENRDAIRLSRGIPLDAFVISYVGRHNEIKGYGDLLACVPNILKANNAWMLVAGKEGPLFPPSLPNWIEEGWTSDPHSIIAASDIFVLPNRETFFDLILLEVMSLGIPIAASATGGNRFFENKCSGLLLYKNPSQLGNIISTLHDMTLSDRQKLGNMNKSYFNQHHTTSIFAHNYIKLLDSLT